ncbi:MAG: hydrogenase expression/formation protein HypE [Geobacteraceae bacterium GWC2_55_20]|nr:MAG: hydrogenase expression/formation protein HypE [Geobacteraceae bacterium GWC2_55_20]OGU26680.1 MAG: hydrogenase expression/formation protein HypE [Geobacteraceae bacterium GWF2_54_21]HBA73250.1 hydrogenase expression/formation protein HypE [Geobacter sp.]HCE68698.1 hydrogenase expression/formation protein HypE [Geobacter sp.]
MNNDIILLGHGSGGRLSHQLLDELVIPIVSGMDVAGQNDAALLEPIPGRLAYTTDSFVVDPIFFPGGTIGSLAVHGTVNDLAMMGARPLWLSVGLIIEEGFSRAELKTILEDMRQAADAAGVRIVTGDTKVVPRGKADKIFINTSGIGAVEHQITIHGANARVGDVIIISGTIGDHGIAVMAGREGLEVGTDIVSDSAALNGLAADIIAAVGDSLHVLRDPTRGGVATTIKEIAQQSAVSITLREEALPVNPAVRGVCSILGLDPLFVANEGKLLAFVAPDAADLALAAIRRHPLGANAAVIGAVEESPAGRVRMETVVGGMRAVEMLSGEQLPRIC